MYKRIGICQEEPGDVAGIRSVNENAFGQPEEANIVDALRAAGGVILSLVAVEEGEIVGHILFSPVTIESEVGVFAAVGLAPMAVLPTHQRKGIGSKLVQTGLEKLRPMGHEAVIVLGHAEYYPRFGFVPASKYSIRWEMEVPDDVFMVLELKHGALHERGGVVRYRPEFTAVAD